MQKEMKKSEKCRNKEEMQKKNAERKKIEK